MLRRIFFAVFVVMFCVIAKDFYQYSVEHSYAWVNYKYHALFGAILFAMLTLTIEKKFKF